MTVAPSYSPVTVTVDLSPFTYADPLREAKYLQANLPSSGRYPGYQLVSLSAATFHGWPAAKWVFQWHPMGIAALGTADVTEYLVMARTPAGSQPYALSLSCPESEDAAQLPTFRTMLTTFSPAP